MHEIADSRHPRFSARRGFDDGEEAAGNGSDGGHPHRLIDLEMMVTLGGKERSEPEFTALLAQAGLRATDGTARGEHDLDERALMATPGNLRNCETTTP
jgi:hypothetical protein